MPRIILAEDSSNDMFTSFMLDQRAHIEKKIYQKRYPDFDFRQFIVTDTSAPELADSIARMREDFTGESDWKDMDSDDFPLVDTTIDAGSLQISEIKLGYKYGRTEVLRASQVGINLPDRRAMAANRRLEMDTTRRVLFGSKAKAAGGLFNWAGKGEDQITVNTATLSIGAILDELSKRTIPTYQPIISFFQQYVNQIELGDTNTLFRPSFCGVPTDAYRKLSTTVIPGFGGKSALQAVEETVGIKLMPHFLLIKNKMQHKDVVSLKKDRLFFGSRNEDVAKFHLPMPKRLLNPYTPNGGAMWIQPMVQRTGLTEILIPKAFSYVDMPDYDYTAA